MGAEHEMTSVFIGQHGDRRLGAYLAEYGHHARHRTGWPHRFRLAAYQQHLRAGALDTDRRFPDARSIRNPSLRDRQRNVCEVPDSVIPTYRRRSECTTASDELIWVREWPQC